jgi:hypothetical protein
MLRSHVMQALDWDDRSDVYYFYGFGAIRLALFALFV